MKPPQTFAVLVALLVLPGCSSSPPEDGASSVAQEIVAGGLYYSQNEDGTFSVTKVLAVDDFAVHLRSYANKFTEKPVDVDPNVLTLGSIGDSGGFGIGHFPLAKEGFFNDTPVFIKQVPVRDEELEGYRIYLKAESGSE